MSDTCSSCGAKIEGGLEACQKLARAWGRSVWDAFVMHHHWAKNELRQILGNRL